MRLDAALADVSSEAFDETPSLGGEVSVGSKRHPSVRIELVARDRMLSGALAPFGPEASLVARHAVLERRIESDGSETIIGSCFGGPHSLRHTLRFATQPALLRTGWLLLHACSVRLDDGVHVFAAPSGTGKTTLARRLSEAGATVLGDEVALVSAEGEVAVHPGQQWHGARSDGGRLAAIHLLGRGEPSRRRIGATQAIARLLSLTMVYEDFPETVGVALAALTRLVTTTPVFATLVPDDARATRLPALEGETG